MLSIMNNVHSGDPIGLDERDVMGDETMIAWVKPSEVALV